MSRRQLRGLGVMGALGLAALGGVLERVYEAESVARAGDLPTARAVPGPEGDARMEPLRVAVLEEVDPATAGLDPSRLDDAVAAVRREVSRGALPGGALAVGRGSGLVMLKGIGRTEWDGPAVDPERTIYDVASLTKVVATTTAVMLLVEDGRLALDAPVQRYLPEFSGGAKALVTIRHLLTHTSGLPAGVGVHGLSPEEALLKILFTPLKHQPGEKMAYSDPGFITLAAAAERAAGEPLPQLLERRVFAPLGMRSTRYGPIEGCGECAPTMIEKGEPLRGVVHDPTARRLGGTAGHAGLFSTAKDLGRFAAMLAGGGELDGVRVLKTETIRDFTGRQPGAGTRALGWDTPERDGTGAAGLRISPRAFGHTGFTGTSLWVDPDRGTWTVLLTNRTFEPRAANRIQSLRRTVHDEVARAARPDGPRGALAD